jgi:hypothetical protein
MTTIGLVLIFFALAAYRSVFTVSLTLDRAGEMHAIWKHGSYIVTISINVPSIATEMFFIYLLQSHSPQHVSAPMGHLQVKHTSARTGPKHVVVNEIVINKKHFSCD